MRGYLVTCELNKADGYVPLMRALSSMGRRFWGSNHWDPRQWIIHSDLPPDAICEQLRALVYPGDRLLIVAIQDGCWAGITDGVTLEA